MSGHFGDGTLGCRPLATWTIVHRPSLPSEALTQSMELRDKTLKKLGLIIRQSREAAALSQEALADKADYNFTSEWECLIQRSS